MEREQAEAYVNATNHATPGSEAWQIAVERAMAKELPTGALMETMRIYVVFDDGTEARYDVTSVRVSTPVSVAVEYSQLVLTAPESDEGQRP